MLRSLAMAVPSFRPLCSYLLFDVPCRAISLWADWFTSSPPECTHAVAVLAGRAGGKSVSHAPTSGPHAGDKKPKNLKGSGAAKKGAHAHTLFSTACPACREGLTAPVGVSGPVHHNMGTRTTRNAGGSGGKFTWGSMMEGEDGVSALDRCDFMRARAMHVDLPLARLYMPACLPACTRPLPPHW